MHASVTTRLTPASKCNESGQDTGSYGEQPPEQATCPEGNHPK